MSLELAKQMAVNAVNYETSDYDLNWESKSGYEYQDEYYINLECKNKEIKIRVSNIEIEEDQDMFDPEDTNWIWSAKFEVCMYEDSYEDCCFWNTDVRHLWIAILSKDGWPK